MRSVVVTEAPVERTRTFSGVSRPAVETQLSFRVAGGIERLPVDRGTRVDKGDVIAALDDDDFRIRVGEAEAAVAQARAQERNASANYERVRRLYENDNAALSDLDAARAANESARAQVRAAEQRRAMARQQLKYTTLRAPTDGVIAAVRVEADENVTPGQTVATLHDAQRLEVEIDVPETFIGDIRTGQTARVSFDAVPGTVFEAEVTQVAPSAVGRATFPVRMKLTELDRRLRAGLAAQVEMDLATGGAEEDGELVVPPVAIGEDREGRFGWVVVPSLTDAGVGVVQRRSVTVGDLQTDGLVVTSGLEPGDRLVVAGISYLEDGQRVRLTEEE